MRWPSLWQAHKAIFFILSGFWVFCLITEFPGLSRYTPRFWISHLVLLMGSVLRCFVPFCVPWRILCLSTFPSLVLLFSPTLCWVLVFLFYCGNCSFPYLVFCFLHLIASIVSSCASTCFSFPHYLPPSVLCALCSVFPLLYASLLRGLPFWFQDVFSSCFSDPIAKISDCYRLNYVLLVMFLSSSSQQPIWGFGQYCSARRMINRAIFPQLEKAAESNTLVKVLLSLLAISSSEEFVSHETEDMRFTTLMSAV